MEIVLALFGPTGPLGDPDCSVVIAKALLDDFIVVIKGPPLRARVMAIQVETYI